MKTPPEPVRTPRADLDASPRPGRDGIDRPAEQSPVGDAGAPDPAGQAASAGVGTRIRELRKQRGMTLNDLSGLSGVSRAFLSSVERNEKSPTLPVAVRIAEGLGITMSALLGVELAAAEVALHRRQNRLTFRDPQSGFEREVLSPPRPGGGAEIVLHRIPPGRSSGLLPAYAAPVEKHILVQEGELTAFIDGGVHRASPGDTLSFTASAPYRLCNEGTGTCTYVVVMVHRR